MLVKVILGILIIGFAVGFVESAEGLIEFKKYKVINSPKVCGDKLCSEIDEKIAKKGESSRNIKVCGDRLCSDFSKEQKSFNKSSPFGQLKLGIAIDLIQCKEGQELVIKTTNSFPACVKIENVEKLRDKGWAISEKIQQELFSEFVENRKKGIGSNKTIEDFDVTMTITMEQINNQRYLMFDGNGWHRLHNVEITITGGMFSERLLSKTDDRGHLNMPWPIPDEIGGQKYNIFATDGIHEFEIDIPISTKNSGVSQTKGDDRCSRITFPINWAGCDLYGKLMSNVDLRRANLQGANLFGVTLSGQDLTGANFGGVSLKKGNLDGATLIGANFEGANLVDAKIRYADLSFAKFQFAKLYRTDFTNSNLTNVNFQDATLSYSILASTDLNGANLDNAGTWAANLNNCINHPICD
jgi:hypothetical protein